jgi:thiamine-phosphate pyrophosphorylase
LPVSVCAIGGITVENAEPLLAAGANLLAVITDLFEAPDVGRRASAYKQLFERNNHELTQSTTI